MNNKTKETKKQGKKNLKTNIFEQEVLKKKIEAVEAELKASTWHDLETSGKFAKNDKLSFISDDMLIVGCDIGSETHYIRAIDTRGREISKDAFSFSNSQEGFERAKAWMITLAAESDKKQIVLGLEPTGHYWFAIAAWMVSNHISVVQVNPYAVKQSKEIEDNSQRKDDRKDPKLIANLVKDGNYGMPYLPEGIYADMRRLSSFRDQLSEDRIRNMNRLHRNLKIYFPEYRDAFGKIDGAFTLAVLKETPIPSEIADHGPEGLREIWRNAGLKGRGYSKAEEIVEYARNSIGMKDGSGAGKKEIQWQVRWIQMIDEEMKITEEELHTKCMEIPHAENIVKINGIGDNILSGILAEMGDISRFDDVKEIQKLSGLSLVASSSGKHNGQSRISYRGRKRLRYWLFQAAKSAVAHAEEFKELHVYYTTRDENPLKKMQSLVAIACKILRVIYCILKKGSKYDPEKLRKDIRRPKAGSSQTAA